MVGNEESVNIGKYKLYRLGKFYPIADKPRPIKVIFETETDAKLVKQVLISSKKKAQNPLLKTLVIGMDRTNYQQGMYSKQLKKLALMRAGGDREMMLVERMGVTSIVNKKLVPEIKDKHKLTRTSAEKKKRELTRTSTRNNRVIPAQMYQELFTIVQQ